MIKLTIYLVRNPKMSFVEFAEYHKDKNIPLFASLSVVREKVRRFVISHTINAKIPGLPPRRFDGIAELWFDDLSSMHEVFNSSEYQTKAKPDEEKYLDLKACNYIISNELKPVIGSNAIDALGRYKESCDRIRFTTLLIRNPKMTFEEFVKHHKEKHAPLFSSIPIIQKNIRRYVISHTVSTELTNFSSKKYDGIVEFWFDNFFSMISVFINPKYLKKVRPDERRFLDLKACDFIISKELPPIIY